MKALSLHQPWAELIAQGKKTIETRKWTTPYRGPLLICASKRPQIDDLPVGCTVCVATLVDCRPMRREDERAACCDVYAGAFSWLLEGIYRVPNLEIRGQLGLYDPPDDIRRQIKRFLLAQSFHSKK